MTLVNRPKRDTRHHQRQRGRHHRHNDRYMKTYWPYLPMLLIVGLGLLVNSIWASHGVLGVNSDFSNAALLKNTNAQRAQNHETALVINQQLSAAAQAKANDMAQRDYWSHDTPDGKPPWTFITAAGYSYQAAGENLAYGFANATDTVAGWMNSPTHKANILNAGYKDVGFGVAQAPNYQGKGPETIIVAEYGTPAESSGQLAVAGTGQGAAPTSTELAAKPVSRIQLLTGQAQWTTMLVSALAGAAITVFFIRHGLYLRRLLLQGESFIVHHPMLDITLVFVGTMAVIFAQASGTIH